MDHAVTICDRIGKRYWKSQSVTSIGRENLKSQSVIASERWNGRPLAFGVPVWNFNGVLWLIIIDLPLLR